MDIETFRHYVMNMKGVEETLPFGPDTLVYKVMGKIFAITGLDATEFRVNLKCDPERAIQLREEYPGDIIPGWHMNKQHWNTVYFETGLSRELLIELIHDSYDLIVESLPKKLQEELRSLDE